MKKYYRNKQRKRYNTNFNLLLVFTILGVWFIKYDYKKILVQSYSKGVILVILFIIILVSIGAIIKLINHRVTRNKFVSKRYCEIDRMNGEEFELFLKAHFEKQGYLVKTTPNSNDYGVDLICKKGGSTMAIQAKRYKGKVGIGAVQEVVGGMNYYNCNVGIVATNSYFTSNAWKLAKKSGVWLWDRNKLTEIFNIPDV